MSGPEAAILKSVTPEAWFEAAVHDLPTLLVDHANCEKKAASTALGLMFSYAEDETLGRQLSRLAREELRHYEQVLALMQGLGIPYARLSPGRYAGRLRAHLRSHEPERKLDLLLIGALIEARSAERFEGLIPRLPEAVATCYRSLSAAEARHKNLYEALATAHAESAGLEVTERLSVLAALEAELAVSPDRELRFHSGPPGAS